MTACPIGTCQPSTRRLPHSARKTAARCDGYPPLTSPISQHPIHEGRKRIDITYTNMATAGFFKWLAAHYPSAQIFVECKNCTRDLKNPELDQLSSRFSPSRGQVGLLACRSLEDKELFERRCRDTRID